MNRDKYGYSLITLTIYTYSYIIYSIYSYNQTLNIKRFNSYG